MADFSSEDDAFESLATLSAGWASKGAEDGACGR